MTHKKFAYNGTTYHRLAVLHAVGQLQEMFGYAKLSDIARFMNISKPAAYRHVKRLVESTELFVTKTNKKGRGGFDMYYLPADLMEEFQSGQYVKSYQIYQGILSDENNR